MCTHTVGLGKINNAQDIKQDNKKEAYKFSDTQASSEQVTEPVVKLKSANKGNNISAGSSAEKTAMK